MRQLWCRDGGSDVGFMTGGGELLSPGTSGRATPPNGAGPSSDHGGFYYQQDSLSPQDASYSPDGHGSPYDASPRGNFEED